ncbi:MAG: hypothetical protein LC803_22295 [Acidobacteria bacterium]|nr:hypothetical protein [Acidobacteriota bacterium]
MSESVRNWLERAAEFIPGYSGYQQQEARRDSDKLYREYLSNRLRATKTVLTDAMLALTAHDGLNMLGTIDRSIRKLDRAENQIRFASYGYRGFFDTVRIQEAQLDELYGFDLSLSENVANIEKAAQTLRLSVVDKEEIATMIANVDASLDELERAWQRRTDVINQFGQAASEEQQP